MRVLAADEIATTLPVARALDGARAAFRAISEGRASVAARQHLELPAGTALLMGAAAAGVGIVAKVVAVIPGNAARGLPGTAGAIMLLDEATGSPLLVADGAAFTAWRTAAIAACATDLLAPRGARTAALVGCGTQGSAQLPALEAVRQLEEIRVLAHEPARARAFVERHRASTRARLVAAEDAATALAGAEIVVSATNAERPVFGPLELATRAHLTALGSFRPGMCEFDPALLAGAAVFVEARGSAALEAGELIAGSAAGHTRREEWTELGEVLAGRRPGRAGAAQRTVFKSVGHALFDLYLARALADAADPVT